MDAILHGGDLFDLARPSHQAVAQVAELLRQSPVPIYVVPGNHDLVGQNPTTLSDTELGILASAGVVKILDRDHPLVLPDAIVFGQPYYPDMDQSPRDYQLDPFPLGKWSLLVAHGMLVPQRLPWDIPQVTIDQVDPRLAADLTVVGHYHPGFDLVEIHADRPVRFMNPGALARTDAGYESWERTVQVLLAGPDTFERIPIRAARPAAEVLTREHLEVAAAREAKLSAFKESLQVERQGVSFRDVFRRLVEDVDPEVKQEAQAFLEQAEAEVGQDDLPVTAQVPITRIELTNFQSHAHSVLELSAGVNALTGLNSHGKSAVLRALAWALWNNRRGSGFIREGADRVEVRIDWADGRKLIRSRTRKNGGTYELIYPNGEITTLSGVGSDLPDEVVRFTGMPKISLIRDSEVPLLYASQLEGAFFLSESPSTRAAIVGRLTGAHVADAALRETAAEIQRTRRELARATERQQSLATAMEEFADLPALGVKLATARELLSQVETRQDKLAALEDLKKRFATVQAERDELAGRRQALLEVVGEARTVSDLLQNQLLRLAQLSELDIRWADTQKARTETEDFLSRFPGFARPLLERAARKLERLLRLEELASGWEANQAERQQLDMRLAHYRRLPLVSRMMERVQDKFQHIDHLCFLAMGLLEYRTNKSSLEQRLEEVRAEYAKAVHAWDEAIAEIGVCPLCGQELSSLHVQMREEAV